jgi:hypothetical protein
MKAKHALIGLAIVIPSFIAGAMLNELAFGQDKKASPSEWKYKVVDLMFQKPEDGSEPLATLGFDLDVQKVQKTIEGLLNQNGAGGWELVSYSKTTAVYRQRVKP